MKIARVLFADVKNGPRYVGQLVGCDLRIPIARCGRCGKGVTLPIVGQVCSANCGAFVDEVITEGDRLGERETTALASQLIDAAMTAKGAER